MTYAGNTTGGTVTSVNTRTGAVTLTAADVGLANANNTSDANKPVSTAQQTALNLKADLASPTFTGTVAGITAAMVGAPSGSGTSTGTNTGDQTSVVGITGTKLQFDTAITDGNFMYVGDAPTAHTHAIADTTGLQAALDAKAPLASPTFTGTVTLPAAQVVNGVTLKIDQGTSNFLRGDGTYAAPSGGGGGASQAQVLAITSMRV